jgi:hypothetical protein
LRELYPVEASTLLSKEGTGNTREVEGGDDEPVASRLVVETIGGDRRATLR